MAVEWYLMGNKTPQYNGGFERAEHYDYFPAQFAETLETTALGEDVVLYEDSDLNEDLALHIKAAVQNKTVDGIIQDHLRHIITPIGVLKLGMYVKFHDKIYLICEYPDHNTIYEKAIMYACNFKIRWLNEEGEQVERWCWINDPIRFLPGVWGNVNMTLGDMRREIYLPKDAETIRVKRDKRFIIDDYDKAQVQAPNVYKITKQNLVQTTAHGRSLFIFIVEEDIFNPVTDDAALMLADCRKAETSGTPVIGKSGLVY